jgi:hypothetical protein
MEGHGCLAAVSISRAASIAKLSGLLALRYGFLWIVRERRKKSVPQGLKPAEFWPIYGTAKAVPFVWRSGASKSNASTFTQPVRKTKTPPHHPDEEPAPHNPSQAG